MRRGHKYSWLIAIILLWGCVLWNSEAALAEGNYSTGRTWGIGVFPPNTLSIRLWLSDNIGLEGTFSLLPVMGAAFNQDITIETLVLTSIAAGPLLKMTDAELADIYGGVQLGVINAVWRYHLDDYVDTSLIFLPGVGAIAGLEVSPSPKMSLSFEAGLWISYMGRIIIVPARILMFLFPETFTLGVHYYF